MHAFVGWSKATRPNRELKRVNVDFPKWVVDGLDKKAQNLGVTRQSLIKIWIAERVEGVTHSSTVGLLLSRSAMASGFETVEIAVPRKWGRLSLWYFFEH